MHLSMFSQTMGYKSHISSMFYPSNAIIFVIDANQASIKSSSSQSGTAWMAA